MSNDSAGEETTDPTPTRPLDIVQPESTTAATLGEAEPFTESWTQAIKVLDEELIGGPRLLTPRDVAKQLGVSVVSARKIWRAMGFPNIQATEKVFTTQDVAAMATIVELVREDVLNEETAISIARSIGQMTDRMVVWQIEALVEDKMNSESLSDPEARREVVRLLPSVIESLEDVVTYSYRRQLNSALQRLTVRVEAGLAASEEGRDGTEDDTPLPLARAVGFADMVSYTALSRTMSERTLAQMVQRFEQTCAEIIAVGGGHLVKTVGDEVLFNAETPEAGAEIALALSQALSEDPVLPSARVSVVWGRVLSRLGDIYGSTVNLAARLTALADPGTVLVDQLTASVLADDERYILIPQPPQSVRGFGLINPSMLLRGAGDGIEVD
ncbi:MAG TPA: adenylate/guanylate cyclase domain-containing protein [Enteractinococcus helveticum]|uniref:Adenylate/guanylate cyclase domain-containing protein n=1 Tax=Enteractinococcus helveticum TaxID=1837282 RepID=A0A921FL87_9MICC|nr:adenylate/guanylate cyclase domain-containing protein [Enteractinococcus helveticum]HJF14265.1 adenylate/guanylate cyclase domain-containing protein [Enteractinococcus helveticum]